MTQIYYDPTGGFLYGIDSNGKPELIKTDACVLMPENVFVDSLGQIHVKNLQGQDTIIMDESGNPATLRGPEGQPGIQGEQGRPSIFRGTISTPQDMDIKIYKGAQTGDSYIISGVEDNPDLPIEEQNGSIYTVIDDKNDGVWEYSGNIRGPKGVDGRDGASGTKFIIPTSLFTDSNIINLNLGHDDAFYQTLQDGDYTISVDTQTMWTWSTNGGGFSKLFILRGAPGVNAPQPNIEDGYWYIGKTNTNIKAVGQDGLTPYINEEGYWCIGETNTDVRAIGKDGENQFTADEVSELKTLSKTIEGIQVENSIKFNNVDAAMQNLQSRITALEQALQNIDLSGLAVAYPLNNE